MPTQTWPRRAPPAGTAAAKKRSSSATQTSARDVAAEGASCEDGRGEEDVHNAVTTVTPATQSAGSGRRRR